MAHPPTFHPISKKSEIDALAAPARQEILDTIESLQGEASVADLATQLGRPADGLYYHLRLLVRAGLLVQLPGDGGPRRYRSIAAPGARLALKYEPGRRSRQAASVKRTVGGLLRIAGRDFDRGLDRADAVVEGELRELWASRAKGWVSDADLREINRLLQKLVGMLHRGRDARRDRLISLAWVLAPLDAQPSRRKSGSD